MALKIKNRHKSKSTVSASGPLVQAKLNEAIALHQQGRFEQAIALYSDVLKIEPRHFDAIHLLGVIADQMKNHQLAADLIDQAIAINSSNADAYFNRGNALKELNRLDAAVSSYDKAIRLNPRYASACNNRGIVLQKLNQFSAAVESYDKAVRIKPDYAEAYFNRGVALQELKRFDEALASYRRVTALKSDYVTAHYNSGVALHALKRFDEALASYDRAISLNPNYAEAYSNRGATLQELTRFDDALASYDRAIALKPDHSGAYFNRANSLVDIGRPESALADYGKAIEIEPDFAEARLNLGHAFYNLDDLDRALAAYQNVLNVDPFNFGFDAAVQLAIQHYVSGNHEECRAKLDASIRILENADLERINVRAYWRYLDKLLSWWQLNRDASQAQSAGTLYVVGESHALSAHGMVVPCNGQSMQCVAELVFGCKQWHLGNGDPNKYKHKFEAVIARLPRESAILLVFGEIDCRHDEGIIKAWEKMPDKSLDDIVKSTVDSYIDYARRTAAHRGHRLVIGGVPATNIRLDALSKMEIERFVQVIRVFNATLKRQALASGLGFLDIYALTDRGDGIASGDWHIETHHLLPSAMVEAFAKHYIHQ